LLTWFGFNFNRLRHGDVPIQKHRDQLWRRFVGRHPVHSALLAGPAGAFRAQTAFLPQGRAPRASEVLIVSLDRESAETLGLPRKTQQWPRSLHAQLIQTLSGQGATVIIFDLLFDEAQDIDADKAFGAAVADAQKIVLCESIRQEKVPITDSSGKYLADLNIETLIPPISPLDQSALALAPFPLPKVPVQLSQFWMFKAGAGNAPTCRWSLFSSMHPAITILFTIFSTTFTPTSIRPYARIGMKSWSSAV
jgi:hypothetical protein